ncbi:hypothetical protein CON95_27060 [Bacillus toyonensis]|uniref:hypothetical protein n=1 Tax=Bacillus toyonensis TaxID=155322 RepID=UPI000BEE66FB|nr:hypothetical protein [Bacillus toyonensis]PEE20758.1 hypothetical protein CON95_27060 [Bacillus toyonensis]
MAVTVVCSDCTKDYEQDLKVDNLPGRIEKCYDVCPHCKTEHVMCYVNDAIRRDQKQVTKVQKRITREMQKLRKQIEG